MSSNIKSKTSFQPLSIDVNDKSSKLRKGKENGIDYAQKKYTSVWGQRWNYKLILIWIHGLAIFVHASLAVVGTIVYVYTPVVNTPILLHLVDYGQASGTTFYTQLNASVIAQYPVFLGGFMVEWITLLAHMCYLWNILWNDEIPTKGHWQRWVEYGITATLMSFNAQLSIGMNDLYVLVVCVGHGVALQPLGYLIEQLPRDDSTKSTRMRKVFGNMYGFIGFFINFPTVALYIIHSNLSANTPSSFNENIAFFFVYFNLFGLNSTLYNAKMGAWVDFRWVECMYNVLSLVTKTATFVIPFATYRGLAEATGVTTKVGVNWDVVRYVLGDTIPLVVLILFIVVFLPSTRKR